MKKFLFAITLLLSIHASAQLSTNQKKQVDGMIKTAITTQGKLITAQADAIKNLQQENIAIEKQLSETITHKRAMDSILMIRTDWDRVLLKDLLKADTVKTNLINLLTKDLSAVKSTAADALKKASETETFLFPDFNITIDAATKVKTFKLRK